jgi:hypothetical protein
MDPALVCPSSGDLSQLMLYRLRALRAIGSNWEPSMPRADARVPLGPRFGKAGTLLSNCRDHPRSILIPCTLGVSDPKDLDPLLGLFS